MVQLHQRRKIPFDRDFILNTLHTTTSKSANEAVKEQDRRWRPGLVSLSFATVRYKITLRSKQTTSFNSTCRCPNLPTLGFSGIQSLPQVLSHLLPRKKHPEVCQSQGGKGKVTTPGWFGAQRFFEVVATRRNPPLANNLTFHSSTSSEVLCNGRQSKISLLRRVVKLQHRLVLLGKTIRYGFAQFMFRDRGEPIVYQQSHRISCEKFEGIASVLETPGEVK